MARLEEKKNILSNNKIVIIDYHMGNLRSVQKAFEKIGCDALITSDINKIKNASKIVLPGVGAFADGMKNLQKLKLLSLLEDEILVKKKPFLGICLGMQLLSNKSYENTKTKGFGWLNAEVVKFNFDKYSKKLKIPHIGWNDIAYKNQTKLFKNIPNKSDFYFVHSYHLKTDEDIITSTTEYGFNFISSIQKENIYAVQFHPEKSQKVGLELLKNFTKLEYKEYRC
jgi:glutamine amidotransferase